MPKTVALVALLFLIAGCNSSSGPTSVRFDKKTQPELTAAPESGEYALYTTTDTMPKAIQRINKGDRLGFEKNDKGQIKAVAGPYSRILPPNTEQAHWDLRK